MREETKERSYIAIDLKSFYASVECMERGLDPLDTNLVVADMSRTEKTICLAVSPSLKSYGVSGRARLFEVVQKAREINNIRRRQAPGRQFSGSSYVYSELCRDNSLQLDYIVAKPRMALYVDYSTRIYDIYLKYVAPEDIHIYSIDEVFMDVTDYLDTYKKTPHELAVTIIHDVLKTTGITATAGIGTNLYLCKIAMDIEAKHMAPDKDGVRIGQLDERSYREKMWNHQPIRDFWRIGKGYEKKLAEHGMYTMGDVARCSIGSDKDIHNQKLLYKLFGVNAEILIDHAWGYEPCLIGDIKAYRPEVSSISSGQVLQEPYTYDKAKLVMREMADAIALDLVYKKLVTDQIVITIGYDVLNLTDPKLRSKYRGEITTNHYGKSVPKHAHGTENLGRFCASSKLIIEGAMRIFEREVNPNLLVRRLNITCAHVISEEDSRTANTATNEQLDLFTDYEALDREKEEENKALAEEKNMQEAIIAIKEKFGKNAILKGMNYREGATARERNRQIGGHHE